MEKSLLIYVVYYTSLYIYVKVN